MHVGGVMDIESAYVLIRCFSFIIQHVYVLFSDANDPISLRLPSQLCVVMIFLVTVVMCRGIISVMMFHTGSPVLRTEVYQSFRAFHW